MQNSSRVERESHADAKDRERLPPDWGVPRNEAKWLFSAIRNDTRKCGWTRGAGFFGIARIRGEVRRI